MHRAAVATASTVAGIALLLALKPHHSPAAATATATRSEPTGKATAPPASASGTYKGKVVDTRYGPVQVEATVSQGRITAVRAIRLPSDNGRDREIAAIAVPQLTQEAIAAGNAHIDAVSGATYTSEGYISSLQSALDRAGA
ncbi:FMN-binding protein [Actinomadura barringtoniae]|uniref:FMN-binding protein n=1 Tax=Actinomadura barringtoniae TaxID=1427535 RepID=A0A939T586_9ACTN|nr:FMN-binding protein [Actinomadura barringtoniae]MBO2453456.1 FMN-binding protein [Actinomadura barringtoniae]